MRRNRRTQQGRWFQNVATVGEIRFRCINTTSRSKNKKIHPPWFIHASSGLLHARHRRDTAGPQLSPRVTITDYGFSASENYDVVQDETNRDKERQEKLPKDSSGHCRPVSISYKWSTFKLFRYLYYLLNNPEQLKYQYSSESGICTITETNTYRNTSN